MSWKFGNSDIHVIPFGKSFATDFTFQFHFPPPTTNRDTKIWLYFVKTFPRKLNDNVAALDGISGKKINRKEKLKKGNCVQTESPFEEKCKGKENFY